MTWTDSPVYIVTIRRNDLEEPDPVHVFADNKAMAEAGVRHMYGDRLLKVLSVKREPKRRRLP